MPRVGEVLDYPPPNVYVPTRIPEQRKNVRNEGDLIGKPIKLQGGDDGKSDVWFKQDDQFDQPYVFAKVRVATNDLDFPRTVQSHIFINLWQTMLQEHNREIKYTGDVAGIAFEQTRSLETLGFQLYCYNEAYDSFFADVFSDVKDFEPTREFFETCRLRMIRSIQNQKLSEPSTLISTYFTEAMYTDYATFDQLLTEF